MSIEKAIESIKAFQGQSLTRSLAQIEGEVPGFGIDEMERFCSLRNIDSEFLSSALEVKKVAGQINVIIHAAGILGSLPGLLRPGEVVESVSLGAGNTGRNFDLETNQRIAEYKFIDWQGGSETIRQNAVFKDYFELAEYETEKEKFLFVVGTEIPLRFFNSNRAIDSVCKQYPAILGQLREKYGSSISVVREYFSLKEREVEICDISPYIGRSA